MVDTEGRVIRLAVLILVLMAATVPTGAAASPAFPFLTYDVPDTHSTPSTLGTGASLGSITFCEDVGEEGELINPGTLFPRGTRFVYAHFTYMGMRSDLLWRREWLHEGRLLLAIDERWAHDEAGWVAYPLEAEDNLADGMYTLNLYLGERLVQQATFRIGSLPPRSSQVRQQARQASIGPVIFCEDVTDLGEPVNPREHFPGGTTEIWAFFTYQGMVPGQNWGRLWQLDGETYIDATAEAWDMPSSGWAAYSIYDESGLESGEYILTVYVEGRLAQGGSFSVGMLPADFQTAPRFGSIAFGQGITEERELIAPASVFDFGIEQVFAVFDYARLGEGQSWAREWLHNGELVEHSGELSWDGRESGTTYLWIAPHEAGRVLTSGEYTLNLYLDNELAQSGSFTVGERPGLHVPTVPATPEEIIHPDLLEAWYRLVSCPTPVIQELASLVLELHIPVTIEEDYEGLAAYKKVCTDPPQVGEVIVGRTYWRESDWDDLTATLAHELTHAVQHLTGRHPCECTVEKEFYAWKTQLYVLGDRGRDDLKAQYAKLYNADETLNETALWRVVKETYSECREH